MRPGSGEIRGGGEPPTLSNQSRYVCQVNLILIIGNRSDIVHKYRSQVSQTFLTESVLLAMSWQTVYACLLGTQKNP